VNLDGVVGSALWAHLSKRFLFPIAEEGVSGRLFVGVGRKCMSSLTAANWRSSFVRPKIRPVKNTWVFTLGGGNFAQRCPFLKKAVMGKV
jgi:hypothetical protein